MSKGTRRAARRQCSLTPTRLTTTGTIPERPRNREPRPPHALHLHLLHLRHLRATLRIAWVIRIASLKPISPSVIRHWIFDPRADTLGRHPLDRLAILILAERAQPIVAPIQDAATRRERRRVGEPQSGGGRCALGGIRALRASEGTEWGSGRRRGTGHGDTATGRRGDGATRRRGEGRIGSVASMSFAGRGLRSIRGVPGGGRFGFVPSVFLLRGRRDPGSYRPVDGSEGGDHRGSSSPRCAAPA